MNDTGYNIALFDLETQRTAEMVLQAHEHEIKRALPYRGNSPHLAAEATMQRSNREYY
jgi:hypothetical protein